MVEDDADVRALAVTYLSELGYRVLEAAEAQAALALFEDGQAIDLLFVDLVLPGTLDGHALAAGRPHVGGVASDETGRVAPQPRAL